MWTMFFRLAWRGAACALVAVLLQGCGNLYMHGAAAGGTGGSDSLGGRVGVGARLSW